MQIVTTNALSEAQRSAVLALQTACETADGAVYDAFLSNELNFDRELPCFSLAYEGERLAAFLTAFLPTPREAEITAFTAPDRRRRGLFSALLAPMAARCARAGIPRLLLRLNAASESGAAVLPHLAPTAFDHAENRLICRPEDAVKPESGTTLHIASEADAEEFVSIQSAAFGDDPSEGAQFFAQALAAPDREALLLRAPEGTAGVCTVHYEAERAFLYGVAVRPALQGRGYGRALLTHALARAFLRRDAVLLEVDIENPTALGLYSGCGFRTVLREDYHALELTDARLAAMQEKN